MSIPTLTGAILSGGQATRMGGLDKGLVTLGKIPLYQHVLQRLQPQVSGVIISANRNIEEYQKSGYPVLSDSISGFKGPLAGILTVLEHSPTEWVLFAPATHRLFQPIWRKLCGQAGKALWQPMPTTESAPTLLSHLLANSLFSPCEITYWVAIAN